MTSKTTLKPILKPMTHLDNKTFMNGWILIGIKKKRFR